MIGRSPGRTAHRAAAPDGRPPGSEEPDDRSFMSLDCTVPPFLRWSPVGLPMASRGKHNSLGVRRIRQACSGNGAGRGVPPPGGVGLAGHRRDHPTPHSALSNTRLRRPARRCPTPLHGNGGSRCLTAMSHAQHPRHTRHTRDNARAPRGPIPHPPAHALPHTDPSPRLMQPDGHTRAACHRLRPPCRMRCHHQRVLRLPFDGPWHPACCDATP